MDMYRILAGDNGTFRYKQNFESSEFDLSGLHCILEYWKPSISDHITFGSSKWYVQYTKILIYNIITICRTCVFIITLKPSKSAIRVNNIFSLFPIRQSSQSLCSHHL